jgi:small-conductance mechanosensitive channel
METPTMDQTVQFLTDLMADSSRLLALARSLSLIVVGLIVARLFSRTLARLLADRVDAQRMILLRRLSFYTIAVLFIVTSLSQLGFELGVLLGAAGVFSIAIGFASQTSFSNLISGLFLVAEKPFSIGDLIQIGSTTGEVLGIDLLSVKLRSLDNRFIRIPNETVIKSEVVTLTRFPIRRADLALSVGYGEDLDHVEQVLMNVARKNLLCLDEPRPLFLVQGFGDSSIDLQFSVWAARERYLELKNSAYADVKRAFDEAGIEIPFPQRSLNAGRHSPPIAVTLVESDPKRMATL